MRLKGMFDRMDPRWLFVLMVGPACAGGLACLACLLHEWLATFMDGEGSEDDDELRNNSP